MKRVLKSGLSLALTLLLVFSLSAGAFAGNGKVSYSGNAGEFIFAPGTKYSPTDLFPNLKDVMPGDVLKQKITVRNNADKKVKVKIYMRSLGADDPASAEFLRQMTLRVVKNDDSPMFEAYADETAQLTDWVCLGLLYSGGEIDLDVTLDVPITMGNEFMDRIGYLDWQFMVEEYPVSPDDPHPPDTGDRFKPVLWGTLAVASLLVIILLPRKRREEDEEGMVTK